MDQSALAELDAPSQPVAVSVVTGEAIAAIVEAARRAPSGDNCQPWRFSWDGERLRVVFLAERAESFYDVQHAASWISLGAVLTNMRVVARHLGLEVDVDLFPRDEPREIVARVRLQPGDSAGDALCPAIPARCVNRRPYRAEPLPSGIRDELMAAGASCSGVCLSWIEDRRTLARLAALAAQNDRLLVEHRALHDGLYRWLRWSRADALRSRDGMPVEALELGRLERLGFRLLASWPRARLLGACGLGRLLPIRAQWLYERSGALALLTVSGSRPEDLVRGGEILERIWLTAALRGVALQPITGLTFLLLRLAWTDGVGFGTHHRELLQQVREEFLEIFPWTVRETPVMLFRLGLAPPPSARAPRLPLRDVLAFL